MFDVCAISLLPKSITLLNLVLYEIPQTVVPSEKWDRAKHCTYYY